MATGDDIDESLIVFYLVRCPGGPIRILAYAKATDEGVVKRHYLTTFSKKGCLAEKDEELPWPTFELKSKAEVLQNFSHLLNVNQRTGRRRGFFEFAAKPKK